MVSFNEIPTALRTPFLYAEFDSSRAQQGPSIQPYKLLILGQRMAAGTVAELVPTRVTSAAQAAGYFGEGSMLHGMAERVFDNNVTTETWFCALDDPAGAASEGTITFTGPATAAGTAAIYIAGRRVQVAIASGDADSDIATAAAAAVTADTTLPVTAGAALGVLTLTAKNLGTLGDEIDVRLGYFGEELPAGVAAVVVDMNAGAGLVDLDTVWPVLGEDQFNSIANPFIDAVAYAAIDAELADRFGPMRQNDGVSFSAHSGDFATVAAFGDGVNSKHVSVLANYGSPSPTWEWAGGAASVVAFYAQIDPARPFQTLEIKGILPAVEATRFTREERNLLLFDGIATSAVDAGGAVRIERMITNYQENALGADDTSYLDVNTLTTLSYIRYDFRNYWLTKYPRHKLANDGTRFAAGQAVMTPKIARAECIKKFRDWESLGLVEGIDQFKADIIVERDAQDRNRLNFHLPPDLINQLRVEAVQIGFLL